MQHGRLTMLALIATLSTLLSSALPVFAQDSQVDGEEETDLDLFDGDVERTKTGWPQFMVTIGATKINADGTFAVGLPGKDPITLINFDRAGLDETDASHWISLNWRSSESRWGAWFANWRYDVGGSRSWENEVTIPEYPTIPVGARVESSFDANWYILEATYSFYRSESLDTGIGFGLHTVDIDTQFVAQANIGEEEIDVVYGRIDALAPLPNILAYLHWNFLPRWNLTARYGWFGLNYDKYSGLMTNAHVMVSYELSDRVSLGGAYQFVKLDLDIEEEQYTQIYDVDFDGPMFYLRFRF